MVNGAALAASFYAAGAVAQTCSHVLVPANAQPVVANGWKAQLVAGGLTRPRSLQFDTTGALLVVESGKGISRHRFTDNGGTCLQSNHSHMLVDLTTLNHGLALSADGRTLYASSAEAVFSWPYDARGGAVTGSSRTLVTGMSNNDLVTRTLLLSQKSPGKLLVSRGSSEANRDRASLLSSGLSQIRVFDISNLTADDSPPYNFNTDGTVLGWGLRNSVGVAEHPVTGGIYAVENSVDGVTRNGKDIRENNPGEELNFLGFLNGTATENQGRNFGYPHCFAVWEPSEIPDHDGLVVGQQFAVQENNTLTDEVCGREYVPPRLTFPAHYAPIDLKFEPREGELGFVTFRGSFDRSSPVGYRIASISFDPASGEPKAEPDSHDSLTDIISNKDLSACPDKCFRPVGLAIDDKGRIWFSSDATGEIYVLQRTTSPGQFVAPESGAGGDKDSAAADIKAAMGWWTFAVVVAAFGFCAV
ncbi:soluble quino protein glucose/sorbosone dehydrogenase [Podospora australis]|uniref:Soluble quino protein glucose/sorbosone dehydrogenase n=1 Tax=Podospora australis TaxID=1536484 RepID=A0AAN6WPQ2_9PEZI|nr:soluble quino protein glucose/sorbosone dehydrogenase [Podospora australis]